MASVEVKGFPLPDGRRIDLRVGPGEVVRIVGPNGSGKTSLLRSIAGLAAHRGPQAASIDGRPTASLEAEQLAGLVGWVPQRARDALVGLTVAGEYRLRGLDHDARDHGQEVDKLSAGQARRLVIDLAAARDVLVLDEPDEGLDAIQRERLIQLVAQHPGPVVVVDHGETFADLADRTVTLGAPGPGGLALIPPAGTGENITVQGGAIDRGDTVIDVPSLSLGPGLHVIVGPNGCGKTTWLEHIAARLTEPRVRYLPDDPAWLLVEDTVAAAVDGSDAGVRRALVPPGLSERHPFALSRGEMQRVALTKVLGAAADVYLLDEPEAHLDAAGRSALAGAIGGLVEAGGIVITATHDQGLIDLGEQIRMGAAP